MSRYQTRKTIVFLAAIISMSLITQFGFEFGAGQRLSPAIKIKRDIDLVALQVMQPPKCWPCCHVTHCVYCRDVGDYADA